MDVEYSNRELDSKFTNLLEHMKGFEKDTSDSLDRILVQTTRTNGRVSSLERWQSYVIGFCAAVSILLLPVVFIALKEQLGR